MKTISILGTEYKIGFCDSEDMFDKYNAGECDRYARVIRINREQFEDGNDVTGDINAAISKTVRHEIMHAVLHEAGLDCYSEDEILVDALAVLFPKVQVVLEQVRRVLNGKGDQDL